MSSPARSRPDGLDLAVVALSARALARSGRRAGLKVLAIDLFADSDTREHGTLSVRVKASRGGQGFDRAHLLETLREHAPEGLPVVLGAGFEHRPSLMRAIAKRNPIRGASPETVALLKDPSRFAALLAQLGIRHPDVLTDSSSVPVGENWLSKRAGASGGAHIRIGASSSGRGRYLQRRVEGRAVSALFLADGRRAAVVGFSEQWPDPAPGKPFRYGGAAGPIGLPQQLAGEIAAALDRLVAETGLLGLASADMILTGESFHLIEINPRPGATLDLFDRGETPSLLALHLNACAGALPARLPEASPFAAAIVYTEGSIPPGARPRPVWTADWPSCDETVPAGAPFCTAYASGPSPAAARRLLAQRRTELLASLRASSSVKDNKNTEPA